MYPQINVFVLSKDNNAEENNFTFTLGVEEELYEASVNPTTVHFIQTQEATEKGIAVLPYGGVIMGGNVSSLDPTYVITAEIKGVRYVNPLAVLSTATEVGTTYTLTRESDTPVTPDPDSPTT